MEAKTKFGILDGVERANYYPDGSLKDCILNKENIVFAQCGPLIPQYGEENIRRKYTKSISFYPDGNLKSVSLESQTEISTPIGEMPAELVTFYNTGEVKRVFPTNGKISGCWSEEDERNFNIPLNFSFDFAAFTAMLNGICFYRSGAIKSLTLFPGEKIEIITPAGKISTKKGFSLYESGNLKSVEPDSPVKINTPIGALEAYDPNAVGICADSNSLCFNEDGSLASMLCATNSIAVYPQKEKPAFFTPLKVPSPLNPEEEILIPIKIDFMPEIVAISSDKAKTFKLNECKFSIVKTPLACSSSCADCSSCSICK
ncbi:MAG TPA: hypothetical protein PLM59_05175 [Oscillospiraceae bacterium]|nr:hypothetical protein [Oscillospiraceae bacterium]